MKRRYLWVLIALVLCLGCSTICDVIDHIPTPKPEATATPTPIPEPETLCVPELILTRDAPGSWPPGILLCTQDQVAALIGEKPKKVVGSISFVAYACTDQATGTTQKATYKDYCNVGCTDLSRFGDASKVFAGGPEGKVQNWSVVGDQMYLSKTVGDGTRRGCLWVPWTVPGEWLIQIAWHATENRGTAYLAVYQDIKGKRTVSIYKWAQRSSANATRTITWGTFEFVRK